MPTYPNLPAHRLPYDVDGSTVMYRQMDGSIQNDFNLTERQIFNDESGSSLSPIQFNTAGMFVITFPEPRDVKGWFVADAYGLCTEGAWSADSNDGVGGTWNTFTVTPQTNVQPQYRSSIVSVNYAGCKAIRWKFNAYVSSSYPFPIKTVHVYGDYITASDRLQMWHPTLDQAIDGNYFNWQDVHRNYVGTKTFRLKNISSTLTANSITVSAETLTAGTPSHATFHTFSSDDITYGTTASAGTLSPGAISSVLYNKFSIPANAPTGPWAGRIKAIATTWT
jgi:hypothetical protein